MDTHRETEKEKADAVRWILGAGVCALGLAFFAYSVDKYQESATARDRAHSEMLRELRIAQTSLPSRVTDDRQKVRIPLLAAKSDTDSAVQEHGQPGAHETHDH